MTRPLAGDGATAGLRTGVLTMAAAISLIAVMDLFIKLAARDHAMVELVWARYAVGFAVLLAVTGPRGYVRKLRCRRPGVHLARAALLLTANVAFMSSLAFLPLTDANAIGFAAPLLLTALAYPVLGERPRPGHWAAVVVGFLGVLVVMRPGAGLFHWAAVLPLVMAVCAAVYHVTTPWIARTEDPAITLYVLVPAGAVVASALLPWWWSAPDAAGWLAFLAIGVFGTAGPLLMVRAFAFAPASALAPFFYVHLVWALVFDFAVFGHVPDAVTALGTTLVVASGLYVYYAR